MGFYFYPSMQHLETIAQLCFLHVNCAWYSIDQQWGEQVFLLILQTGKLREYKRFPSFEVQDLCKEPCNSGLNRIKIQSSIPSHFHF